MEIKTNIEFTKNTRVADVYTESSAEYVLPDYNGDVRKILFTDASLRPSGKFAGGDEVEFSGIIVYDVVFLDSENNVSSASFTSEYDYTAKCSGETYKDAFADTRIANYAVRLLGPRKISAKASVVGGVRLSERGEINIVGDGLEAKYEPEVKAKTVNVRKSTPSAAAEREYAELVARLDGAIADEVSVIYSIAEAMPESVEAGDESVTVKGKLRMCAVIKNADAPAYLAEKTVAFEEAVPFEGVSEDMKLTADLTVTSLKASINADDAGSEVVLSGIVEFGVIGDKNEALDVIADSYIKTFATDNSYEDLNYSELVSVSSERLAHKADIPRSEVESDKLREVVFISATPKIESVEGSSDSVKISGEIKYSGVATEANDNNEINYIMLKAAAPFSVNINLNCQNRDNLRFETKVNAYGATAEINPNSIICSSDLRINVTACEDRCERILSSSAVREDAPFESHGAKVTVYYPDAGDTLFSVAKRFHTSAVKVAADNSLSEAVSASGETSLSGVKKLIIF